ncbi:MAG: AAA family ATPase [Syntrophomonadaceae bacterium]|nr:AAA family ATPase [Syntrophomonadaceae bacterium]
MLKEVLAGSIVGVFVFLAIIGINILPLILFGLLGGAVFLIFEGQLAAMKGIGKATTGDNISFDDVGGQETAINEFKEALEFLLHPKVIAEMGIRPLKGILLVGPPGTGKTLLAKAAAGYTKSAFVSASGSEFIEMYAGVGAKRVRQLFAEARKKAKREGKQGAIVFIDELEILGAKRGSNQSHMEYDQTLNQLLVEMDGVSTDNQTNLLVVGATNRADMLDAAILRPGRFDRQVAVGLPDKKGRLKILEIHTRNKPITDDVSLDDIAKATFGFSGAQLESLANEAAILALRDNAQAISHKYFIEAIDKVILGEKLDRQPGNEELKRVGIHESGHAVVSEMMKPGSVSSLTIVPRGQALGFMRKNTPEYDQYLYTREELESQIMVALGGAVAEEIVLGARSTGARNDFEQAWKLAHEIVRCGMSGLGVVNADDMPKDATSKECSQILQEVEAEVLQLLLQNRTLLEMVASKLMEEETLDRELFVATLSA